MRFAFTEDQEELRRVVRAFLERRAGSAQVRAVAERDEGFAAEAWGQLVAQMELTSLAIGEAYGGTGASFVEVGIVLEELGRTLLPVPYLATVTAAAAIEHAAPAEVAAPLLERIAGGAIATLAVTEDTRWGADGPSLTTSVRTERSVGHVLDGEKRHVLDGALADVLVVAALLDGAPALFAVESDAVGVERTPQATLDQTRRQASVRFDGAPATLLSAPGAGAAELSYALDLTGVALAVESAGAARRCLELTVDYLRERVQFGRPIGTFQALKHRCADLAVAVEGATATAYYATWAAYGAPDELRVLGPLAQAVCTDAFLTTAGEAIQLHGGIGFTWEHDAHLFFKRAKSSTLLFGGSRAQRRRVGALAGIA